VLSDSGLRGFEAGSSVIQSFAIAAICGFYSLLGNLQSPRCPLRGIKTLRKKPIDLTSFVASVAEYSTELSQCYDNPQSNNGVTLCRFLAPQLWNPREI
jgi:hypothetical protein